MDWPHSQHVVGGRLWVSTPKMKISKKVLTSCRMSVGCVTSPNEQYGHIDLYIKAECVPLSLSRKDDKTNHSTGRRVNAMRRKRAKPNNDDVCPTAGLLRPHNPSACTALNEPEFSEPDDRKRGRLLNAD